VASELAHPTSTPVAVTTHHGSPATPAPTKQWAPAILWGAAVAVLAVGVWMLVLRTHRGQRALALGAGTVVWLVVVFYFFQTVAPLLPASY
jgi:cytochrome c-type biogenesis protein CcmH/NrfF